jgi:hypothetical protein
MTAGERWPPILRRAYGRLFTCLGAVLVTLAGSAAGLGTSAGDLVGTSSGSAGSDDGRATYERGDVRSGGRPLSARAGADGSLVLRGAVVACANCHGLSARGGGEGVLKAPSLLWPQWSSADTSVRASARERLRAALREGTGLDGRRLDPTMPRFDVDQATLDDLVAHISALATDVQITRPIRFALMRRPHNEAPRLEGEVHERLVNCLRDRLGSLVELDIQSVDDEPSALQRQWSTWVSQPDLVAVLAPPWRAWRPVSTELSALFPLVADPDPSRGDAQWLFGGPMSRAAALVQAWSAMRGGEIPVWLGTGNSSRDREHLLRQLTDTVARGGGRVQLQRIDGPTAAAGRMGLWLDPANLPDRGDWLMPLPVAAPITAGSRWWMAQPYIGRPPRPLARRWAEAACATVHAAVTRNPKLDRGTWPRTVAALGRQRDEAGWEWRIPDVDPAAFGASTAWTIIEFAGRNMPLVVAPLVEIGPDTASGTTGAR